MPTTYRKLLTALFAIDAVLLAFIAILAARQELPTLALVSWLDGHGGAMLLPWFVGKLLLIAVLHIQTGHRPHATAWAWLAMAKLAGLHLLAAPALAPHLTGIAEMTALAPGLLGKLAALSAVAAVAVGLFLLAAGQDRAGSHFRLAKFGLLAIALLATVSALPDAIARITPEAVRLMPIAMELCGETLASSWLLVGACTTLKTFAGHSGGVQAVPVGRMSLAGTAASRHVAAQ